MQNLSRAICHAWLKSNHAWIKYTLVRHLYGIAPIVYLIGHTNEIWYSYVVLPRTDKAHDV